MGKEASARLRSTKVATDCTVWLSLLSSSFLTGSYASQSVITGSTYPTMPFNSTHKTDGAAI